MPKNSVRSQLATRVKAHQFYSPDTADLVASPNNLDSESLTGDPNLAIHVYNTTSRSQSGSGDRTNGKKAAQPGHKGKPLVLFKRLNHQDKSHFPQQTKPKHRQSFQNPTTTH